MKQAEIIGKPIFADVLRREMASRSATQEYLAATVEVSQATVAGWLGGATPRADALYRLATAFGVSMEYLLTGHEKGKAPAMLPAPNVEVSEVRRRVKAARAALAIAEEELKKI